MNSEAYPGAVECAQMIFENKAVSLLLERIWHRDYDGGYDSPDTKLLASTQTLIVKTAKDFERRSSDLSIGNLGEHPAGSNASQRSTTKQGMPWHCPWSVRITEAVSGVPHSRRRGYRLADLSSVTAIGMCASQHFESSAFMPMVIPISPNACL
jgi:hypothetical protein